MNALVQTIQTLIRQNLNDLDFRSPIQTDLQTLDDYSRQMEEYLEVVEDMTKTLGKGVKRLRRRQRYFEALIEEADENVQQFSQEGQSKLARAAAERKAVMTEAARAFQTEADIQNARLLEFMDAKLQLEARLTEVNLERARLEARLAREAQLQPV
ncbi:MAG TPA: hypothetical protein EYP25_09890 [Anaerolineae bacterium]|nr:hypothetical protein [Anaerolineae bacterium]